MKQLIVSATVVSLCAGGVLPVNAATMNVRPTSVEPIEAPTTTTNQRLEAQTQRINAQAERVQNQADRVQQRAAATESRLQEQVERTELRAEEIALRIEKRCQLVEARLESLRDRYQVRAEQRREVYRKIRQRIADMVTELQAQGVDTTEVEQYLTELEQKELALLTSYDEYAASVNSSIAVTCSETDSEFFSSLTLTRQEVSDLALQGQEIKTYVRGTIIPAVRELAQTLTTQE